MPHISVLGKLLCDDSGTVLTMPALLAEWCVVKSLARYFRIHHPFAFIPPAGEPYPVATFKHRHRRAVERIGLTVAKALGTTPHGHRPAYRQALGAAGIAPDLVHWPCNA